MKFCFCSFLNIRRNSRERNLDGFNIFRLNQNLYRFIFFRSWVQDIFVISERCREKERFERLSVYRFHSHISCRPESQHTFCGIVHKEFLMLFGHSRKRENDGIFMD